MNKVYSLSTERSQCHLDGDVTFSTEPRFFQCTRSMGTYFHVGSIFVIVLLFFHLVFVLASFLWSLTGKRREPEYVITTNMHYPPRAYHGDAAFLFHYIHKSNFSFVITVIKDLYDKQERG